MMADSSDGRLACTITIFIRKFIQHHFIKIDRVYIEKHQQAVYLKAGIKQGSPLKISAELAEVSCSCILDNCTTKTLIFE